MSIALNLCSFALDQLLDGACKATGDVGGHLTASAVASLKKHLTDHSAKLDKALRTANDRAWRALELALGGETLMQKCAAFFAQADHKAFATQVKRFLDDCPLALGPDGATRQSCFAELQAARKAGLLELPQGSVVSAAAGFTRFSDPQQRVQDGVQTVAGMAAELKERGYRYLAWLVASQPMPGASLLVIAVRFFFRREVESDQQLWQGLAWASWQKISETQEHGFACLGAALAQNVSQLERLLAQLAETRQVVEKTHQVAINVLTAVQGQSDQIAALARQVQ